MFGGGEDKKVAIFFKVCRHSNIENLNVSTTTIADSLNRSKFYPGRKTVEKDLENSNTL